MKISRDILIRAFLPMFYHKRESDFAGKHQKWSIVNHTLGISGALILDLGVLGVLFIVTIFANFLLGVVLLVGYQLSIEFIPRWISKIYRRIRP